MKFVLKEIAISASVTVGLDADIGTLGNGFLILGLSRARRYDNHVAAHAMWLDTQLKPNEDACFKPEMVR